MSFLKIQILSFMVISCLVLVWPMSGIVMRGLGRARERVWRGEAMSAGIFLREEMAPALEAWWLLWAVYLLWCFVFGDAIAKVPEGVMLCPILWPVEAAWRVWQGMPAFVRLFGSGHWNPVYGSFFLALCLGLWLTCTAVMIAIAPLVGTRRTLVVNAIVGAIVLYFVINWVVYRFVPMDWYHAMWYRTPVKIINGRLYVYPHFNCVACLVLVLVMLRQFMKQGGRWLRAGDE